MRAAGEVAHDMYRLSPEGDETARRDTVTA